MSRTPSPQGNQASPSLKQHFVSPKARAKPPALNQTGSPSALTAVPEEEAPFQGVLQGERPTLQQHGTGGIVTGEDVASEVRSKFDYPSARFLTLMQIGMSMGYCAYMLTAWLYASIQQYTLFPTCSILWGGAGTWGAWGCIAAALIFWTFPLFCCIVFLMYMYRDLLHTRLYYEMFSHRVHLDFMNIGFFQAPMVIVMIVWMVLCLLVYPMTWSLSFSKILMTMPFWIPVLSFGFFLFCQWDLETRLLSVCKFVEGDVEWANKHMMESYFLRDYVAEAAFHNVLKKLEKQSRPPKLTMGEYFMLICEEAERMYETGTQPTEDLASKTLIASWSSRYWVKLLIYSEYIVDEEAKKFHWWFGIYKAFTVFFVVFFLGLAFITTVTHIHNQGLIPSSPLTEWVHLDYLSIIPYNPNVPGQSQANAIAATVTSGGYHYIRNLDRIGEGKVLASPPHTPPEHELHKVLSGPGVPAGQPTQDSVSKTKEHSTGKSSRTDERRDQRTVERPAEGSQKEGGTNAWKTLKKAAGLPSGSTNKVQKPASGSQTEYRTAAEPKSSIKDRKAIAPFGSHDVDVKSSKRSSNKKDIVDTSNLIDDLLNRFPRRRTSLTQKAQHMQKTAL